MNNSENLFLFPSHWQVKAIKEFANVKGGKRLPRGASLIQTKTAHPYIRIVDFKDGRVDKSNLMYVPDDIFPLISRYVISKDDVYISIVGTVGFVGMVDEELDGANLTENAAKICEIDNYVVDRNFLAAYLQSDLGQREIKAQTVGSTQPKLALFRIEDIRVPIPPLPEQRAIAAVLGALDDKIELNRRMNRTLEAIAQAVFRRWFVENEEAEGWEVVPLPEIIDINPQRLLRKGEVAPYLDMANMPTQGHRAIQWTDRPYGSGTKFINGDTLLARITPCLENGKTAFVDFLENGQVGWGSTEYIVFRPKLPLPPEFGYYLARSEELRNYAIVNMTGTSGRQRAPASCFDNYLISVPPVKLAKKFGEFAKSIMAKIKANDEQSRTLAALRDALLPKLMRGDVRVTVHE